MKKIIKRIVNLFHLELNYLYDYCCFKKNYCSTVLASKKESGVDSWILQDKHRIEKALSLPIPRLGFGAEVLTRLSQNLSKSLANKGKDTVYYLGVGAIKAYSEFHFENGEQLPAFFVPINSKFEGDFTHTECDSVGVVKYSKEWHEEWPFFESFVSSRHSCRNFLDKEVTAETFHKAMKLAVKAPSVCNRQHWRVNFYSGEDKLKILSLQNGNAGFTDNIPYIAVVSSRLDAFYTPHERNQPYTDGGVFAMNFMYALHSLGVASCALNWCNSFIKERKFSQLGLIPKSEKVILLVAIGYPNLNGVHAMSPRIETSSFYKINF